MRSPLGAIMTLMKNISVLLLSILIVSCNSNESIPQELEMSFEYIEAHWTSEDIIAFKEANERSATIDQHFGMGMYLRNTWIRNHEKSEQIQNYFASMQIFHSDDISSIILTSYHRHLNDKEISLEEQVEYYQNYWAEGDECDKKQTARGEAYLKEYGLGDSVTIKMPFDAEENNATNYACYDDWEEFDSTSLLVKGILIGILDTGEIDYSKFDVLILSKNIPDANLFNSPLWLKDTLSVSLKSSWHIYPYSYSN